MMLDMLYESGGLAKGKFGVVRTLKLRRGLILTCETLTDFLTGYPNLHFSEFH